MTKRQIVLLFICNWGIWVIGNGLVPLLPIYAVKLGASQGVAGYYLAIAFLSLAVGTIFAGWLSDRIQRRKQLLIIAGLILMPSIWMMGVASNVWQLVVATTVAWLMCGITLAIVTILAGLFATKEERGRVIGIIGVAMGLGGIVGGLSIGPIVDRWGYPTMFLVLCIFLLIIPTAAIFVKDKKIERAPKRTSKEQEAKPRFGKAFYLLLLAQLLALTMNPIGTIGRSLSMDSLGFSAAALTSTSVISGAVSIPFPFALGWLSDRLGRKRMMAICYTAFTLSVLILAFSKSLWHFWMVMILSKTGLVCTSVGAAFVTDLAEPRALGRGVSLFQSMGWLAYTIGSVVAGNAFQSLGIATTSLISVTLPVIGIILIMLIRVKKQEEVVAD